MSEGKDYTQYRWKGIPITELTKEELMEALTTMAELYHKLYKDHIEALDRLCGE